MRCPHCEKDIDESLFTSPLTYCPLCGQNLKVSDTEEKTTKRILFCPHCKRELPGKVSFCPYCGKELAIPTVPRYERLEYTKPGERSAKSKLEPPPHKKKADKLYKDWVKYANLPPEAISSTETPREMPVRRGKPVGQKIPARQVKILQRIPVLYIIYFLLGICVIAFVLYFALSS